MTDEAKRPKLKLATLQPAVARVVNDKAPAPLDTSWGGAHQGTRHERGYGSDWDRRRARILKRDNHTCQCTRCKASGIFKPANTVDHIVPKEEGGTDADDNLQAINTECHRLKTAEEATRGIRRLHGKARGNAES